MDGGYGGRNEEEKGLLWKLPVVKSGHLGRLGPAFGVGAGCGFGFAVGLIGGLLLPIQLSCHLFMIIIDSAVLL